VDGLELSRRHHAELAVEPALVEPVDESEGGVLDVFQAAPRAATVDQLGLVEPVEGLARAVS
jgi:hypothetical protein